MLLNYLKPGRQRFMLKNIKLIFNAKQNYSSEVTIETKQSLVHNLEKAPSASVTLTKEDALTLYKNMFTVRTLERAASTLYKEKVIRGFCHLYTGQEAVAVGIHACMKPGDDFITAYRCHGWAYLMGLPAAVILSELAGRSDGCSRGKGGSMHIYGKHFYGGNGIVGAQVPLGVGIGFANKYLNHSNMTIAAYGDGAANQGQVAEVFNMAALFKIPVLFLCENNQYGMGTSAERSSANPKYYTQCEYIPGIRVNGMDVVAVREATRMAREYIETVKTPIILEAETYRYYGHSMSDPGTSYRSHEEIQQVRKNSDPIVKFRELVMDHELVVADEFKDIEKMVKVEIDDAIAKSRKSPELPIEDLTADVCTDQEILKFIRVVLPDKIMPHRRTKRT